MNEPEKKVVRETKVVGIRYSPFWAVFFVFLTFSVVQCFYLKGAFDQRAQIKAGDEQLTKILPQAQAINQTVENVGRELIALSNAKSAEAAKIISEFKIQMNAPAPRAVPPPQEK